MGQDISNLYQLDGRVPVGKAVPFGLQHVLAMFVSNITPIMILAGAIGIDSVTSSMLIQNCMIIAGIGTLVQLYPIWRIGSRLLSSWVFHSPSCRWPSASLPHKAWVH